MKLYITRHGQTTWNVDNKVCGVTDVELTDKGIAQAEALADIVLDKNIDIIISSPLKRALHTSNIIANKCGARIITDDRLREQNYGIYEGVDRTNDEFFNYNLENCTLLEYDL